jgi:hypothetical protein
MKKSFLRFFAVFGAVVSSSILYGQAGSGYSFTWGDGASAGNYSFAQGYHATAVGNAFAFGDSAYAGMGYYGVNIALGFSASATSTYYIPEASISIGDSSDASWGSVSLGHDASSNNQSLAVGAYSRALMSFSAAFGRSAQATALGSLALGFQTYSPSVGGVGIGMGNKALRKDGSSPTSYSTGGGDPILMVGNSVFSSSTLADTSRSNALTVYRDGDVHVAGKVRVQPGGDIPMFSTVRPTGVSYP